MNKRVVITQIYSTYTESLTCIIMSAVESIVRFIR